MREPNHRLQPTPSSLRCAAASRRGSGPALGAKGAEKKTRGKPLSQGVESSCQGGTGRTKVRFPYACGALPRPGGEAEAP